MTRTLGLAMILLGSAWWAPVAAAASPSTRPAAPPSSGPAADRPDVKVDFTLKTTDAAGAAITQSRSYFVYRPERLSKDKPAPMVLCMQNSPATFLHRKADEAGFVLVSCVIKGHTTPTRDGFDDIDYATAVIDRVGQAENCNDAFMCGLSMAGHMTCAYACERPKKIRAAAVVDEFMGLTTNIPTAPVPMIFFHGTKDAAVPYAMVKDTVDAWRATNGLMGVKPVTLYWPSRAPGDVTQATWEGAKPVAFVTVVGGGHAWAPGAPDAMWAFFAQFLTAAEHSPRITSQPTNNVQQSGQPASFQVAATGDAPLSYQWQKNGKDIPGATSNWYTTGPAGKDDSGAAYRAVVSNKLGSVTSGEAKLTVLAAPAGPSITLQPKDQAAIAGKPVTFAVGVADAPGLRYQWQKNGMDIVGAAAASYTIPAAITADCGATFRVVVSGASGSTTSTPAALAVTPAPGGPVIVTNPARARVHPGETATFTVAARSDTPMTYQWQQVSWQQGTPSTNYVDITGATAASYTTRATTLEDTRTLFRCVVTNAAGNATSAGEILVVSNADRPTKPAPTRPSSGK